jgi:Bacterial Ig-like domain (group 3)
MIRGMSTSGDGRLRVPSFGLAVLACVLSALLWTLVLAPAARADAAPQLTDKTTPSTTSAVVGDSITLTPGTYGDDPGNLAVTDTWYDCNSASPPPTSINATPAGCTPIAPSTPTSYVVGVGDQGDYITVLETDALAVALGDQTNQAVSNTLLAVPAAPPPPPTAPTSLYAPSIAGTSTSGSTLTAVTGGWSPTGSIYSYSWSRCSDNLSSCTVISNAATYKLSDNDLGGYILLSQSATATNAGGSTTATATSSPFGPITTPAPVVTPPDPPNPGPAVPTVSGTPQVGATLTAAPATMSNNPSYSYQWLRCVGQSCTALPGATGTTYTPVAADLGDALVFSETGTNAGGSGQAQSTKTALVAAALPPPPPAPTSLAAPSIAGSMTSGSTLTAMSGLWTGSGNSYSYAWARCNSSGGDCVTESTAGTYQLSGNDVGGYILLSQSATATNAGGSTTATAPSSPFGPITTPVGTDPPPATPAAGTAVPTVSGTPQVGVTLTAAPVTMTNNPSYAYQWLRCAGQSCTAIAGATATTYSPIGSDLGDALVFSETGTNAGGSGKAQSTKTAVVTAATQTTLQITPSGVVAGQPATLVATVTSTASQAPPTGVITFEQNGTAIPGCASIATHPSGASATITCQTTFVGSSSTLSAVFTPSPGAQVTGSDSSAIGFVLGRAATTATMILPSHVTVGKHVELTAKVVPEAGTIGVSPTGDVVFLDGTKTIKGCAPTLANGIAHCTVTYTALGAHSISADYLGDGNFSGSATRVHKLAVVVAKPTGFVSSLMTWTFRFKPLYTRVSTLTVTGVQPALTIAVGCSGHGCPKHDYVDTIKRTACGTRDRCKNVKIAKRFADRKLGVGATLTVRLTHPGWLGKYYAFVVRPGRKPKIDTACLAVGQTRPDAGCTPE